MTAQVGDHVRLFYKDSIYDSGVVHGTLLAIKKTPGGATWAIMRLVDNGLVLRRYLGNVQTVRRCSKHRIGIQ